MTLIFILIALGLDFFLGGIERFRVFSWWTGLFYQAEKKIGHIALWSGPLGVIILLLVPMALVIGLQLYLDYWSWFFEAVYTLLLLIYCLAPEKLDDELDYYISAIDDGNETERQRLEQAIVNPLVIEGEQVKEIDIIKSAFVDAHQRTFAVIFWFLVLGIAGAVLYRLVCELNKELREIRSGFADSLRDLLDILEWPSSRLLVLGMALAGHLMDAINGWRSSEAFSVHVNNKVLTGGGLGALQYQPDVEVPERSKSYWIGELKAQLNRTLIIWLAVIAIMTLSGNLG